jgi:16S rRNA (guanine966-N2)-methyltransferase
VRAPKGWETRPTIARVRQALFQILGDLGDARVVDFYAGSGALGIEALSRGAAQVVFVEASRTATMSLRRNLADLDVEPQAHVIQRATDRARPLLEAFAPFDLAMADPPWAGAERAADEVVSVLYGLLAPKARVVIGHRAKKPVEPEAPWLELVAHRHWGDSGLSFFRVVP